MKRSVCVFSAALVVLVSLSGCRWPSDKIKEHIEVIGSELTGTSVTIEKLRIKPVRGAGAIEGFRIANPGGFVAKNAFSFEKILLNIGLVSTLTGDPVVLDEVVVAYPVLNFERDAAGLSNLSQIYQQVEKRREQADTKSEEESGEKIRLKVKALKLEGITLNVRLPDGSSRSAILPPVVLEDIGGETGISPALFSMTVAGVMTGEILKQAIARELIERSGNIKAALATDNLMALISYRLTLTPEIEARVRPIVDELSRALIATIDGWVEKGHVDLAELEEQFTPILQTFEQRLQDILEGEQFAEIRARLPEIKNNAIEVLRCLVAGKIAEQLDLAPEQVQELLPIFHDYVARVSALLADFVSEPDMGKEAFIDAFEELGQEVIERLSGYLSAEQVEAFRAMSLELMQRIETVLERYRQRAPRRDYGSNPK